MFACNRHETKVIMSGTGAGFARKYDGGCPLNVGDTLILTSLYLDGSGRNIPFAKAHIQTIRPGTVREFREDNVLAEIGGYPNGNVWYGHMNQMYPGLGDTDKMYFFKVQVFEIDKDAGTRPDVKHD